MEAYSIKRVAELSGLSRDTIEREIARGNLKARKVGRVYRIPERWYLEWLHREPEAAQQVVPKRSQSADDQAKAVSETPPQASGIAALRAQQRQARQFNTTSTAGPKTKP